MSFLSLFWHSTETCFLPGGSNPSANALKSSSSIILTQGPIYGNALLGLIWLWAISMLDWIIQHWPWRFHLFFHNDSCHMVNIIIMLNSEFQTFSKPFSKPFSKKSCKKFQNRVVVFSTFAHYIYMHYHRHIKCKKTIDKHNKWASLITSFFEHTEKVTSGTSLQKTVALLIMILSLTKLTSFAYSMHIHALIFLII